MKSRIILDMISSVVKITNTTYETYPIIQTWKIWKISFTKKTKQRTVISHLSNRTLGCLSRPVRFSTARHACSVQLPSLMNVLSMTERVLPSVLLTLKCLPALSMIW